MGKEDRLEERPKGEVAAWVSKKVPIGFGTPSGTVDYAMKEFGCSFRTTVDTDDERAMRRTAERLWLEAEEAVDQQIRRGAGDHGRLGFQQQAPQQQPTPQQAGGQQSPPPRNGNSRPQPSGDRVPGGATVKSVNFLMKIANDRRVDLRRIINERFNKGAIDQLSQREVSDILENVFNIKNNKTRRP